MAYTTGNQNTLTPEVSNSRGMVRVKLGVVYLNLLESEAQALGLQLLQQAKFLRMERAARADAPAIQHGNADIHDPADAEAVAA